MTQFSVDYWTVENTQIFSSMSQEFSILDEELLSSTEAIYEGNFTQPISARFVRVNVLDWLDNGEGIAMRIGVRLCSNLLSPEIRRTTSNWFTIAD